QTVTMLLLILLPVAFLLPPGAGAGEIVGGHEARPHSRPYMAFLHISGGRVRTCGGFLVAENFVLTAAHCQGRNITVVLGAQNIKEQEPCQQVSQVKRQIPHRSFNWENANNDIMLLQLARPARLNAFVKPVGLPRAGVTVSPGTVCSVAGWGLTNARKLSSEPSRLQETVVEVLSDQLCIERNFNPATMLCAGRREEGRNVAKGDSGGPLTCGGVAQGIVSWGRPLPPAMYTRVSTYSQWIQATIRELQA
uniref:Mast cell protease 1A-like n=1 Tax=Pelodiscus sinensis TaxID=13735 RepID=K7F7P1_PELSI